MKTLTASPRLRAPLWMALAFLVLLPLLTVGIHTALQGTALGIDYNIYWHAGRYLLYEGGNPYSDEIGRRVQQGLYRRPALPGEDQMAYAYPPYNLLLSLPFASLPFDWSQALWMALTILALVAAALYSFPRAPVLPLLAMLFYYPYVFGIVLGNYVTFISAGLMVVYSLLVRRRIFTGWLPVLAGVILAWSTGKVQFFWLFALFFGLYCLRERVWRTLVSVVISMIALLVAAFVLVPDWPVTWLERLDKYPAYTEFSPTFIRLLSAFLPQTVVTPLAVGLYVVLAGLGAWLLWRWWKRQIPDPLMFAAVGLLTYCFHPHTLAYESLALFVPFLLLTFGQSQPVRVQQGLIWLGGLILSWSLFLLDPFTHNNGDFFMLLVMAAWVIGLFIRRSRPARQVVTVASHGS
jgi:hypothetical protein